ncbi:MAG: response regulator [Candidatus Hydrogenedens sp.]|nr:response regulator [Candidatus Hydrogenedens sp.]
MAKVLLVDDDRELLLRVAGKLQHLGYECRAELSGNGALEFLKQNPVDVILLDVMLPGMSGFEVCRQIRRRPATAGIPVLFVSSMSSEEEVSHALEQGADDFLAKPFHMDDLVRRLERLLSSKSSLELVDQNTELPTAKAIKLAIQNRIHEKLPFALVYIQLEELPAFSKEFGTEARDRVLRHFARSIQQCAEKLESTVYASGHMGGGHFVVTIEDANCVGFCKGVRKFWQAHVPEIYESLNELPRYQKTLAMERGGVPLLKPHICITRHTARENETVGDLLEALSHLRQGNRHATQDDIVFDRRVS